MRLNVRLDRLVECGYHLGDCAGVDEAAGLEEPERDRLFDAFGETRHADEMHPTSALQMLEAPVLNPDPRIHADLDIGVARPVHDMGEVRHPVAQRDGSAIGRSHHLGIVAAVADNLGKLLLHAR